MNHESEVVPTIHQVFASVEPYAVITDLKLPCEERNGSIFTPHPHHAEYDLQVHAKHFIGLRYNNPTPGCNLFDFISLHFGSAEQAVDYLIARYFHLAWTPPGIALVSLRESFIASVKSERKRFEDILALREPFRTHSEKLTFAYMYCRRLSLKADHAWRMFWAASGEQINQVLHYAIKPGAAFDPKEYYFIFPYLKDHHTFSMLQIEDAQGKPVRNIKLDPSGSMFFGYSRVLKWLVISLAGVQRALSTGNFSGYPLFATCPDPSVLARLNYPLFLLADSGLALNPMLDENAQLQIAGVAHQIISLLTVKLMREPVQAHGLIASEPAPAIEALALEGKRIIEASCGIANFELAEPTLPLLQKIFSRVPLAQAHQHLRYDQSLGVLYIRCRHLTDVTRKPLFEELAAQCPQVKLHGSHDISCPADWLLRVLSDHYGQPMVLANLTGATARTPN